MMPEDFGKGHRRRRLGIVRDILQVAVESGDSGSKKTHIMYGANLSYQLLVKYLGVVVRAGLVLDRKSCYLITRKGREFLRFYEDYEKNRRRIEGHIHHLSEGKQTLEAMLAKADEAVR